MSEFFYAVTHHTFMLNAVFTAILAGIACGVVGTYVVSRRITYVAGAIAHSVLGGMGVARYLTVVQGWEWLHPLHGAAGSALLAALIIGWVGLRSREREDTVTSAIWAIGMAVGIVFISRTPGYNEDLMGYLFGNILMVGGEDLILVALLDIVVLVVGGLFYNQFLGVCFDEEFARIRGIRVDLYYLLLLCLTALTVVILVMVVGLVMVIALITLPVAVAGRFTRSLWQTMMLSAVLSVLFAIAGLGLSYRPDLPAGATIILVAGAVYLVVTVGCRWLKGRRY